MSNAAKTQTLETLSNKCSSALARIETCGDEFHAAAIDLEIEMSLILAQDAKLSAEWAEVMAAHNSEIASW